MPQWFYYLSLEYNYNGGQTTLTMYSMLISTMSPHQLQSIQITDSPKIGWGGVLDGTTSGGHWSPQESKEHINCLKLMAALFSLQSLTTHISNTHIRLKIDNTTAVAAINHMDTSHSVQCNNGALDIWKWCIGKRIWVSAEHIPGKYNIAADKESREISTSIEPHSFTSST